MDHFTHRHFLLAYGNPPTGVKGTLFSICADEADARKTLLALTQAVVFLSEEKVSKARKRNKRQVAALMKRGCRVDEVVESEHLKKADEVVDLEEALEQEIAEYKEKAAANVKRRKEEYEQELARMEGPGLTVEEEEWFRDLLKILNTELRETFGQKMVEGIDEDSEESAKYFDDWGRTLEIMYTEIKCYRRPEHIFDTFRFMDSLNRALIFFTSKVEYFEDRFKAKFGGKRQRTA
jgi:hypothetical protein